MTGGLGYIGSHTVVELLNNNYDVIVIDDLSNSNVQVLDRIKQITNKLPLFYLIDITNKNAMSLIFKKHHINFVIHFAAFKAVGESVMNPLAYYNNNVIGSIILLDVMNKYNVKKIVFSSSATIYGVPKVVPIPETESSKSINPYGSSKVVVESLLKEIYVSDNTWNIIILRYFNPVGAHKSGLIGENPNGTPNNLMPYIAQVAVGKLNFLKIFGGDYNTRDGTGVRDYIHVCDLADGHLKALQYLEKNKQEIQIINLGTGTGYSVLDVLKAYEKASNKIIAYQIVERRNGDVATCYADNTLAKKLLNWYPRYDLEDMCKDSWNWQNNNPNGY